MPTTKKRLVIFSHSSNLEGAEISLLDTIKYLSRHKFDIFVSVPKKGLLPDRLTEIGIRPFLTNFDPMRHLQIIQGLRTSKSPLKKILKRILLPVFEIITAPFIILSGIRSKGWLLKIQPNIIYLNTIACADILKSLKIAANHFKNKDIKWVWHIREVLSDDSHLSALRSSFSEIVNIIICHSDVLIFNSETSRDTFLKYIPAGQKNIISDKLHVVYQGFAIPEQKPSSVTGRFSAEKITIGMVGSVTPSKKQDLAIKAMSFLKNYNKKLNLVIYGRRMPEYYNGLRRLLERCRLSGNVIFYDYVADLRFSMREYFSILIAPSTKEPFGRVVVEAMLQRIPVIAANSGGYKEIIQNDMTGLLIEPEDPHKIAMAIRKMIENPEMTESFINNAFAFARKRFKISDYINTMEKLFYN